MATDNPDFPPGSPDIANAAPLPPIGGAVARDSKKRRPLWQRIIIYAVLAAIVIVVFLFILGVIVGKPKDTDVTSVLRRVTTDMAFGNQAGMTGRFGEAQSLARDPPVGLKATFVWKSRPSGIDAEITTFDTDAQAAAAFEQLKSGGPGPSSLLFPESPDQVVTTEYQGFTQTREDSPITKKVECGQREHEYACGSVVGGVPAILVVREPLEADWHKPGVDTFNAADPGSDDPEVAMKGMEAMAAKLDKSDKLSKEMREIDKTLQRLGLPVQVLEAKNPPK